MDGKGSASIISDSEITNLADKKDIKAEGMPIEYLLWGEGTGEQMPKEWSKLATASIGSLDVPVAGVRDGSRVKITGIEYLIEYEDGNVAVSEERLTGMEVLK